ncbi:MAG: sugar phosphate isomerase/epimerase [Oscillospiraceae bacterium]|nr:sugar phosphate isomerase/epimerase [Oscillospiraceae bacterium]
MGKQFTFGILPDAAPIDKLSKRWDYLEIPAHIHCAIELGEDRWDEMKDTYVNTGIPVLSSSHLLPSSYACGPKYNKEYVAFVLEIEMRRLAELGVKYVGCYGGHFGCPEGFSRSRAMDQAIDSVNLMADAAEKYGLEVALEPIGKTYTLFPKYADGLDFIKECGRKSIKIMADMEYFAHLDQTFDVILKAPELCVNAHIGGEKAQPNVGGDAHHKSMRRFFEVLREAGYDKGVTSACPWKPTNGAEEIDWAYETEKTLDYLQELRAQVYK